LQKRTFLSFLLYIANYNFSSLAVEDKKVFTSHSASQYKKLFFTTAAKRRKEEVKNKIANNNKKVFRAKI
jgi:hypothetical protein